MGAIVALPTDCEADRHVELVTTATAGQALVHVDGSRVFAHLARRSLLEDASDQIATDDFACCVLLGDGGDAGALEGAALLEGLAALQGGLTA